MYMLHIIKSVELLIISLPSLIDIDYQSNIIIYSFFTIVNRNVIIN
ncbi:hypothetical protein UT300015_24340 [Clostridium tertium]